MITIILAAYTLTQVYPPQQYDHPPQVLPDYQYISPKAMQLICGAQEYFVYSCSRINRLGWCQVYLPDRLLWSERRLTVDDVTMLKRHEDGHCNGWIGTHPGAIIKGVFTGGS